MEIKFPFMRASNISTSGVYDSRDLKGRVCRFRDVECELLRLFRQSFGDYLVGLALAIDVNKIAYVGRI
jgi:hypothetical protein